MAGIGFALLQLCIPAIVGLTQEPPARFGWHMFAAPGPVATIELDGRHQVRLTDVFAQPRPEIDYASDAVVDFVCTTFEPAFVVITDRGDRVRRECR